jgi:hypothetical protein
MATQGIVDTRGARFGGLEAANIVLLGGAIIAFDGAESVNP